MNNNQIVQPPSFPLSLPHSQKNLLLKSQALVEFIMVNKASNILAFLTIHNTLQAQSHI